MSIRWEDLGRQKFEDLVSVLLSRLHPDSQRIDGKGGDGGRDVQIVHAGDGLIVDAFELKSFTGRMGSVQRPQVKNSLDRAADLGPARWTLVVPIDPTPRELDWFHRMGENYGFPREWRGKTWLDEKMALFPDIRRYFVEGAKDEVYRLLLELREEQARVTDVHDAMGRLRTLYERLNEIDPYYRYEFATVTGTANSWPSDVVFSVRRGDVRVDAYAKYRGAVEDQPVFIRVMVTVGPEDLPILEPLGYGLETTIPHRMISSMTIDLPSGLGGNFSGGEFNGEFIIVPADTELDDPIILSLRLMAEDRVVASYPVQLKEQTSGPRGSVFTGTDSTGWLTMRLTVNVVDEDVEAEFRVIPQSGMPNALVSLFQWLDAFQPAHYLNIRWPKGFEAHSEISRPFWTEGSPVRFVEALAYLQGRTAVYWDMPLSYTDEEASEIVTIAAMMKGEIIDFRWNAVNLNLDQLCPVVKELANGLPRPFMLEQEIFLQQEGGKVPIGCMRTILESARLADPESFRQDLTADRISPLAVRLVPGDSDKAQKVLVTQAPEMHGESM